jgi:hypothetical protein
MGNSTGIGDRKAESAMGLGKTRKSRQWVLGLTFVLTELLHFSMGTSDVYRAKAKAPGSEENGSE